MLYNEDIKIAIDDPELEHAILKHLRLRPDFANEHHKFQFVDFDSLIFIPLYCIHILIPLMIGSLRSIN